MRAAVTATVSAGKCSSSGRSRGLQGEVPELEVPRCGKGFGAVRGLGDGASGIWGQVRGPTSQLTVCGWGNHQGSDPVGTLSTKTAGTFQCRCTQRVRRCAVNAGPGDHVMALNINAQTKHKQTSSPPACGKCSQATKNRGPRSRTHIRWFCRGVNFCSEI